MKLNHINAEPSRSTKFLLRGTRKTARIRGGFRHPGLAQTAHAARDVGLAIGGIALDFGSLALLYSQLPFHPGICAGLIAFDIAGAAMVHAGVGDKQWRDNQIAVADTVEDQAAIRAQRPGRFALINSIGGLFIALPTALKIGGLVLTPALSILGGWGPALIVSYAAVAVIHWTTTGFAFAHLRARRAERKELNAMLRSSPLAAERDQHENRVKAERRCDFVSPTQLVAIEDVDGHSLKYEGVIGDGHGYVLITNGRLDDDDLDTMVQRQKTAVQAAILYREGLKAQLEIEESEPMSAISAEKEDTGDETSGAALPAPKKPVPTLPTPAVGVIGRAVTAIAVAITMFGVTGCKPKKPEQMKMQIVALASLAANAEQPLPKKVTAFAAPDNPIAGKFVPTVEITRLDTPEPLTTALAPVAEETSGTKNAIDKAWKFQSPELDLARARECVEKAKAGILATASGTPKLARERLAKWATEAVANGSFVVAVGASLNGVSEVDLAPGVKVPAFVTAEEANAKITEQMQAAVPPKTIAIVLDPPAPVKRTPKITEAKTSVPTPKPEPKPKVTNEVAKTEQKTNSDVVPGLSPQPLVIKVDATGKQAPAPATNSKEIVQLPPEAEMIGEPIRFGFGSDKLDTTAAAAVKRIARLIKAFGPRVRVLLLAKTDPRGDADFNEKLAGKRAEAVVGSLLEERIMVERTIAVGERLSPDDAAKAEHAQFREVKVYILREESSQTKLSASQIEQK